MAVFNLDFLKRKADGEKPKPSEERTIKKWMFVAFFTVSFFLLCLNVSGAWVASNGNVFYTGSIAGAEMFVALGLGALVFTRNRLRMGVGAAVFCVAVWITLENGKMAVTHAMDQIFTGTPDELRKLADLADARAVELDKDVTDAKTTTTTNITAVRAEIAELRNEQRILGSPDIYGIQRILQANGYYDKATLDGIRGVETERGILLRGEEIRLRLGVLAEMEKMATAPAPVALPPVADEAETLVAVTPAEAKRQEAIELRKQAKTVEERTVWLNILLIGLESIRSAAFWAFLMDSLRSAWLRRKAAEDDLAQAEVDVEVAALRAKIDAIRAGIAPAAPTPSAPAVVQTPEPAAPAISESPVSESPPPAPPQPEPEIAPEPPPVTQEEAAHMAPPNDPVPEPTPPEFTDAQRRGRAGGLGNAQKNAAVRAKGERLIIVGDWQERDAELASAKIAAE
jgi:hypothetical protein